MTQCRGEEIMSKVDGYTSWADLCKLWLRQTKAVVQISQTSNKQKRDPKIDLTRNSEETIAEGRILLGGLP